MKHEDIQYQSGFGNHFSSEAVPGTLPQGQNTPQKAASGLYAELLSGTAFTMPLKDNQSVWFYRAQPSVTHEPFEQVSHGEVITAGINDLENVASPNQMRWDPLELPTEPTNFIQGQHSLCTTGNMHAHAGSAIHLYGINESMQDEYYYNSDADLLFIPQDGGLILKTECGIIDIDPLEIAVIQRGIKFQVQLKGDSAKGYLCENYGSHFVIPDKGPIGSHGLANTRDFKAPNAWYEERQGDFKLYNKYQGHLWCASIDHSPLDVVAWHGTYAPYKYNLKDFMVINAVSFDHADPSIFTVLTSPSGVPGTANIDFVIFPPRWMVAENTFRPPYYHRNVMSEYMGLIQGEYDAKKGGKGGFIPGGSSLHNCMTSHGPDAATFEGASNAELAPQRYENTMAFMLETKLAFKPTEFALKSGLLQNDYHQCWQGLKKQFSS
jgi:homogentisate 1,2-dioxygenase